MTQSKLYSTRRRKEAKKRLDEIIMILIYVHIRAERRMSEIEYIIILITNLLCVYVCVVSTEGNLAIVNKNHNKSRRPSQHWHQV